MWKLITQTLVQNRISLLQFGSNWMLNGDIFSALYRRSVTCSVYVIKYWKLRRTFRSLFLPQDGLHCVRLSSRRFHRFTSHRNELRALTLGTLFYMQTIESHRILPKLEHELIRRVRNDVSSSSPPSLSMSTEFENW